MLRPHTHAHTHTHPTFDIAGTTRCAVRLHTIDTSVTLELSPHKGSNGMLGPRKDPRQGSSLPLALKEIFGASYFHAQYFLAGEI